MMKSIILAMLLMLGGCNATMQSRGVEIPAQFLQQCQPLQKLEGTTGKDMLRNITDNAAIYHSCADMHKALIEATKPNK